MSSKDTKVIIMPDIKLHCIYLPISHLWKMFFNKIKRNLKKLLMLKELIDP